MGGTHRQLEEERSEKEGETGGKRGRYVWVYLCVDEGETEKGRKGQTTERERNQVRAGTKEKEKEKEKEQEGSIRILKNEDTVNICDKQALAWTELRSKLE